MPKVAADPAIQREEDGQESFIKRLPIISMFVKMYKKYDNKLLTMLGAQYFN